MHDGRPNPNIWGNIITCVEIAEGVYSIVGSRKKGLELPKKVAEEILPDSVMGGAETDGGCVCFTDDVSSAVAADALLEQELVTAPKAISLLEAMRQLESPEYDTGFEPPISDMELAGLDLER